MAVAPHTHTFNIPTATTAEIEAGIESGKAITPDQLKPITDEVFAAAAAAQAAVPNVFPATLTALKAVDTAVNTVAGLTESGRIGQFVWTLGDFTASIAADPLEGLYVKADAIASTVGAWVRAGIDASSPILAAWFGAVPGATDSQPAIEAALTLSKSLKRETWLLGGEYTVASKITMTRGMVLKGTGFGTSSGVEGCTLNSTITNGDPVIYMNDRTLTAEGFKIQGNATGPGLLGGSSCFNHMLTNIHVKDCTVGFDFPDSWTMDWRKCRADDCPIGFRWGQGTTSTFTSLVAFSASDRGFIMEDMKDCVWTGCEPDTAGVAGFDITNCRGITLVSPGIEHLTASASGIRINGTNSDVTIISPSFGDHASVAVNLIDVQAGTGSCVTVIGMKVSSAFAPAVTGKIINKASTATVMLINPQLYGSTQGDVSSCTVIGGVQTNYLQRPLVSISSLTATHHTSLTGTTGNLLTTAETADLITATTGGVYICTAINEASGTHECEYRMSVQGGGTVQAARIVYESAPAAGPQFKWNGNAIRVYNASGSTRNYRYSITRI